MSELADKAVFLSYASQDADAVRRICEALRAAGVEVWFDQSELGGGDAWDAKIRRQIKACALFIPVVSASTQARLEGYFRIEWKIAAQRTHAMAETKVFLLPIVIDATRDEEAHVPEEFRAVQWTRLTDTRAVEGFAARVRRILGDGRPEASPHRESFAGTGASPQTARPRSASGPPKWIVPAAVAIAAGVVLALRQARHKPEAPIVSAAPGLPDGRRSEVQQLLAKAWVQLNSPNLDRPELEIADQLCKSATDLDPNNADAWAAWSQVDTWYLYHDIDRSASRRKTASAKAARAMGLAPESFEARLAQACYFVREGSGGIHETAYGAQAADLLGGLLREQPDEPRALFALGILLRNQKRVEESAAAFDHMARDPAFAVTALAEKAWMLYLNDRYREAWVTVSESFALGPVASNLLLKGVLATRWLGDVKMAEALVAQLPASGVDEDRYASLAVEVHWMKRDPEKLLATINAFPGDWLSSNSFDGPKAYYGGWAYQMAGRPDAAMSEWRRALEQTDERLKEAPNSVSLLTMKGELLVRMGSGERRAEAEEAFRLADQFAGRSGPGLTEALMLGENDTAIRLLANANTLAAFLRLNPTYDPLRGDAQFVALLKRAEADPRLSPTAEEMAAAGATRAAEAE